MYEDYYYILFVDGNPIDFEEYDKGVSRLERLVIEEYDTPFKITEDPYKGNLIKDSRDLNYYCEYHNGCWSPAYDIEDDSNNSLDIKIIENTHLNEHRNSLNKKLLDEFCSKHRIKNGE